MQLPPVKIIPPHHWDRTFIALALQASYCLAACLMEQFTLFLTWSLVSSPMDLAAIHSMARTQTFLIYTLPKIALTFTMAALMWEMSGHFWWQWWCMACLIVHWAVTLGVGLPLHVRVKESGDRVALKRLRESHWVGTGAMVGCAGVVVWEAVVRS